MEVQADTRNERSLTAIAHSAFARRPAAGLMGSVESAFECIANNEGWCRLGNAMTRATWVAYMLVRMNSLVHSFVAVVLPTYDNFHTLPTVLAEVEHHKLKMLVVNDGSTDGTKQWLHEWEAERDDLNRCVVTHLCNRGKAAALLSGFAAARRMECTHVVTIDTDGQLDPREITMVLAEARLHPKALIVGVRDDRAADYPARSRLGRRISNGLIHWECGVSVADSQCGFRVYPLRLFDVVQPRARGYAFETEIITLAAWAGFEVRGVPVTCRYFDDGRAVSHFRVGRETLRAIWLHARLLSRTLARRFFRLSQTKGSLAITDTR